MQDSEMTSHVKCGLFLFSNQGFIKNEMTSQIKLIFSILFSKFNLKFQYNEKERRIN